MSEDIVGRQFMHSCHVKSKFGSAVIVKERVQYSDGRIEPNIAHFINPKRNFYITGKRYRTYKYKPEYELISRLDKYTVQDHQLPEKIAEVLDLGRGYVERAKLFRSPYVFGADISVEALIKMRYADNFPNTNIVPVSGFLDIETSIDTGQIILISFICGSEVFTAVLNSFLYKDVGKNRVKVELDELKKHVETHLDGKTGKLTLNYNIQIFDAEIKLIAWIMQQVHRTRPDFIGIWNMNFDIPRILEAIDRANCSPLEIFSDPRVKREWRYLKYHEDNRPVDHFTLKWHWLYSTCGAQFIDSMGLYSQCRRTNGYKGKYDLDSILADELKIGKLKLAQGSHVIMQRHHFLDYVAYNIFDVVGLELLEQKNKDIMSMHVLAGPTPVAQFAAQTTRATNNMYWNLINKGMVLSSVSRDDDFVKFDRLFSNSGGAVLPPERVTGIGVTLDI